MDDAASKLLCRGGGEGSGEGGIGVMEVTVVVTNGLNCDRDGGDSWV